MTWAACPVQEGLLQLRALPARESKHQARFVRGRAGW